jgi:hypothetical protein
VARLLHTVAQRLRKHTRRLGAFHAWNKCLNHLLALARAHQVCARTCKLAITQVRIRYRTIKHVWHVHHHLLFSLCQLADPTQMLASKV